MSDQVTTSKMLDAVEAVVDAGGRMPLVQYEAMFGPETREAVEGALWLRRKCEDCADIFVTQEGERELSIREYPAG